MTTFLLIPGGGCDASYWRFVVSELAARGHRGVPIDLPCDDGSADLDAYADAVVARHQEPDGRPVVVAHSLGGFTAPLAAARLDASALVYVSAMVPRVGEPPNDWWAATGCAAAQRAAAAVGGYDADDMDALFYNGVDPAVVAQEVERGQSDTPMRRPWPGAAIGDVPVAFVVLEDDRFFPEGFMRGVVADRLGVEPVTAPGGHMAMLSHPTELTEALITVVAALG